MEQSVIFSGGSFVGIDINEGDCVDLVIFWEISHFPDKTFNPIVATDCFPHEKDCRGIPQDAVLQLVPQEP